MCVWLQLCTYVLWLRAERGGEELQEEVEFLNSGEYLAFSRALPTLALTAAMGNLQYPQVWQYVKTFLSFSFAKRKCMHSSCCTIIVYISWHRNWGEYTFHISFKCVREPKVNIQTPENYIKQQRFYYFHYRLSQSMSAGIISFKQNNTLVWFLEWRSRSRKIILCTKIQPHCTNAAPYKAKRWRLIGLRSPLAYCMALLKAETVELKLFLENIKECSSAKNNTFIRGQSVENPPKF